MYKKWDVLVCMALLLFAFAVLAFHVAPQFVGWLDNNLLLALAVDRR